MRLDTLIRSLPDLDLAATICARRPWTAASEAVLVNLEAGPLPDDFKQNGYAYFLEVLVAREILEDAPGPPLTDDETFGLILHYAENDAFPDWLHGRAGVG
jgi:hypothetical protein